MIGMSGYLSVLITIELSSDKLIKKASRASGNVT